MAAAKAAKKESTTTTEKAARPKKVMAWNTKDIREKGGSVVFVSADGGKTFTNIGQFEGVGMALEENIAKALKVPHSKLAEKLGDSIVLSLTTRYIYKSTGKDRA